jgi:hypothetical protein
MESIRISMDPRTKETHEDSKKEREARTTSDYIKNHKICQPDVNSIKEINQRN